MGNDSELSIIVRAKNEATKVLKAVQDDANKLGQSLADNFKRATPASAALAAGVAGVGVAAAAFAKSSVSAYMESENAIAQLEAALKSTGNAAGLTSQDLQEQATALQSMTKFTDEAVMATQSMLLTFTNIKGGVMQEATSTALDMAQALGMDGKQAALQLGKALNSPAEGLSKLQRVGVTFTEQQKKQVEAMVAAGDTAGAQRIILAELRKEFGGSAAAAGQTFAGKLEILKNTFGDLQENVGKFIVDAITPLVSGIASWVGKVQEAGGIMEYFGQKFQENKTVILIVAGAIMMGLVPALLTAAASMWAFMAPLIPWLAAGAVLAILADKLAQKMGGWGEVLDRLKGIFSDVVKGAKIFIEAFRDPDVTSDGWVGTIERIASSARELFDTLVSAGKRAFELFKQAVDFIRPSLEALVSTLVDRLAPALIKLWNAIAPVLIPTLQVVAAVIGVVLVGALWVAINVLNVIISVVSWFINILSSIIGVVVNVVTFIINYLQMLYNFWSAIFTAIWTVVSVAMQIIAVIIATVISVIIGVVSTVANAISAPFIWAFDKVKSVWNGITGFFSDVGSKIGSIASGIKDKLTAPFSAAVEFVKSIPGKMVDAISNIGKLIRDKLGDWDIPGPLGKVKDVIPGFATGVKNFQGGMAWVGERGPELVNLPKGSDVIPNDASMRMAGSGGNTTNQFYGNITLADSTAVDRFFDRLNRDSEMSEFAGVPI